MTTTGGLRVIRPGLQTTVQDLGRWGYQALGVPVAGPMDAFSHRLANALAGNPPEAATLEITLIGPELQAEVGTTVVVCGADFDLSAGNDTVATGTTVSLPPGAILRFGRRRRGARAYLAVAGGGVLVPRVLGSRATHTMTGMGGLDGRILRAGDVLPIAGSASRTIARARGLTLPTGGRARVRVVPGPQDDWFGDNAWRVLTTTSFRLSPRSSRMGYRLEGPPIPRVRADEPVSEPVTMGAIQIPPAGEPILLMADRQTSGGYPKIAQVISADLCMAAQLAPGDFLEFERCTMADAVAALIARERELLAQVPTGRVDG